MKINIYFNLDNYYVAGKKSGPIAWESKFCSWASQKIEVQWPTGQVKLGSIAL